MNDRDALTAISTKLDTLIGAETNGLRDEVPPGSSVQRTEQDASTAGGGTITASPTSISRPSTSASPVSSIETSWNVLHRNTSDPRDVPSEDFTHLGA